MQLRLLARYSDKVLHSTAHATEFDENRHKLAKRLAITESKVGGAFIQRLVHLLATVPQLPRVVGMRAEQLLGQRNRGQNALESSTYSEASRRLLRLYLEENSSPRLLVLHMTAMLNSQSRFAVARPNRTAGATRGHPWGH